jgi:hypothetical protein
VSISFWAQDNNWRVQQQRWTDTLGTASAVGSVLTNALTSQSSGRAAIANHQALKRVGDQLKAAAIAAANQAGLSQLNSTNKSLSTTSKNASSGSSLNLLA